MDRAILYRPKLANVVLKVCRNVNDKAESTGLIVFY